MSIDAAAREIAEWFSAAEDNDVVGFEADVRSLTILLRKHFPPADPVTRERPEFPDGVSMIVIDPGHDYWVRALDGGQPQRITFVKREGGHYPGNVGHYGGIIMQCLQQVIDDRLTYVNNQIPCWESELAKQLTRAAWALLECRAGRTHGRFTEHSTVREFFEQPRCGTCGHVGCTRHGPLPPFTPERPAACGGEEEVK